MQQQSTNATSEAGMRRISATQYAQLTKKQTYGRPSQYYLDRATNPKLFVLPIGVENQITNIIVTYVERPDSFDRYEGNNDVPGRWLGALVAGLALDLAEKRPPYDENLIARLQGKATDAEDIAQRADRDRTSFRMRIGRIR